MEQFRVPSLNFPLISSIVNARGFKAIWAILVTFYIYHPNRPDPPGDFENWGVLGAPHAAPQTPNTLRTPKTPGIRDGFLQWDF